jgi:TetR/AcrR family transcriptional regulator, transcriptional repressor for nem operon
MTTSSGSRSAVVIRPAHDMMNTMRYAEGHKEAVHERIVRAAATALRRHGISGIGIPALMKEAGLTHGGFYSHFENRDALVAEAIRSAAADTATGALSEDKSLAEALRLYLSTGHAEHPELGCVVATLAAESPHQTAPVRRAVADAARELVRLVDRKLHPKRRRNASPSEDGLRLAATMIGAITLARAVDDPALAARILEAARGSVNSSGPEAGA